MPKEPKPQSKSPLPSFYQHLKTPSKEYNFETPRYCSRGKSEHYGKVSRESRYKSCSIFCSEFCSKNIDSPSRHRHFHTMSVLDLAMISNVDTLLHNHIFPLIHTTTSQLVVHIDVTIVLVNAPSFNI